MTPTKLRKIVLNARCWSSDVVVMIGGTERQRRTVLEDVPSEQQDYWIQRMDACSFGKGQYGAITMFSDDVPWDVYVYFPRKPRISNIDEGGQVLHELMHAAICILRRKRVDLCIESEEAYTYLTEHLVREFWTAMKK